MSACTFRPPWPFEMHRFTDLVGTERPPNGWMRPRVWETPAPHRFAGAAWWSPKETGEPDSPVEVRVMLRPQFKSPALASELLRELFLEIRNAGFTQVHLVVGEREVWEAILTPFGLRWNASDQLWAVDAVAVSERIQAGASRWAKLIPAGWCARPIVDSDWGFITSQSGAAEFLIGPNLERVRHDLDPEISSIVQAPSGPVGALLATRIGMTAALEFLGAAPDHRNHAPLISHLAITRFSRRDHPAALFDRLVFTTNPARGGAACALSRRFNGKLIRTYHHFAGCLRVDSAA